MLRLFARGLFLAGFSLALGMLATRATTLVAQATTVTIHGIITGNDGSVPQGAQVGIQSREIGISRIATADSLGAYRVLGLSPGIYDLTIRALGYRQQRHEGVQLVLGHRASLNFELEPGAIELEPIVVTSERPFEVDRSDVPTAVLQEEIEKLPLNSRNVLNIAAVAPGIRTFAVEGGRSGPAAGALPAGEPRFSNLM